MRKKISVDTGIQLVGAAAVAKLLQSCPTLCDPIRWQPTRLLRPWDSPGKNTGVGRHFLLQCMKVKRESEVAQSCPTLCNPMDCSLPGSSIHGIFQARVLEWGAIAKNKPLQILFRALKMVLPTVTQLLYEERGEKEIMSIEQIHCFRFLLLFHLQNG